MNRQKARDAALALTVLGALLLLPPVLPFFDRPLTVFGLPLIVVYLFGVWLALIVLAWAISTRLPTVAGRERGAPAAPTAEPGETAD